MKQKCHGEGKRVHAIASIFGGEWKFTGNVSDTVEVLLSIISVAECVGGRGIQGM